MTVRLRPHHLLCLLTYVGEGYSSAFVDTLDHVGRKLLSGEDLLLVEGPDDICAPVLGTEHDHCTGPSVTERDHKAAQAVSALLGEDLAVGTRLRLDAGTLGRLRKAFASGAIRAGCAGCEWAELCSLVAARGYTGTRL